MHDLGAKRSPVSATVFLLSQVLFKGAANFECISSFLGNDVDMR